MPEKYKSSLTEIIDYTQIQTCKEDIYMYVNKLTKHQLQW